jgi:hypothetical protein
VQVERRTKYACIFFMPKRRLLFNFGLKFLCLYKKNRIFAGKIRCAMVVERVNDEVIIRLPSYINFEAMQRMVDLISLKEAGARSVATQEDVDLLAKEVNKDWWIKNGSRYVK